MLQTPRPLAALLTCFFLAGPAALSAETLVVTKLADTADGACDADCSLREAILAANADPGPSVVMVGPGVYLLTRSGREDAGIAGDLDVTGALQLLGAGATLTVLDGNQLDRVLQVHPGASAEVRGVTIRHGLANGPGGGLCAETELTKVAPDHILTLAEVVVEDNRTTDERGGGIYAFRLVMENSTVARNQAAKFGGGIFGIGGRLSNVTVSGNVAPVSGGGIAWGLDDGDTFTNLTVTGNRGGGFMGSLPTCTEDPACLPKTQLSNSILAGNFEGAECAGGVGSAGHNLYGHHVDECGVEETDRNPNPGLSLHPKLGPLTLAGGTTPVHPLLPGSPALDMGSPAAAGAAGACTPADQRGVARPVDGDADGTARCDVGAVEETTGCVADPSILCLNQGRFRVTARWQTGGGGAGEAGAAGLTSESGTFWFFSPSNVELIVKVLNACAFNGTYWVFATGLTDVGVEIEVEDLESGQIKTYTNPAGTAFAPRFDTEAFATCP